MDESTRMVAAGVVGAAVMGAVAGFAAAMIARARSGAHGMGGIGTGGTGAEGEGVGAQAVAVVGLTAAMLVGLWGAVGMPLWPPRSGDDRVFLIPPLVGLAALAGIMIAMWRGGRRGGGCAPGSRMAVACAGVGAAVGTAAVLGERFWSGELSGMGGRAGWVWVPVAFAAWAAVNAWGIGRVRRSWAQTAGIVMAGLAVAVGAGLLGDSNTQGKEGFAVAMGVIGLVAGLMIGRRAVGAGVIATACGVMGAMLGYGVMLNYTPWWVAGMLGLVGPAAAAADAVVCGRLGNVGGSLARIGAAAVIAGIAVVPGIAALVKFVMETGAQ